MEDRGECSYMYYTICEGETEEEALNDWAIKNNLGKRNFYKDRFGAWLDNGWVMQLVKLYGYVPNHGIWQKLEWIIG